MWLELLRSGEFKQSGGCLEGSEGYCCLGVACIAYERATGKHLKRDVWGRLIGTDLGWYREVQEWVGLDNYHQIDECVRMNDALNLTFEQIADEVEKWTLG